MCWQCSEHRTDALEGQRHGPGSGEELADRVDNSSCEAGLERSQSCKHLEHLDESPVGSGGGEQVVEVGRERQERGGVSRGRRQVTEGCRSSRGRPRIGRGETRRQRLEEDGHGRGRRGGYDARGGGDGAGAAAGEVRHEVVREVDGEVGRGGRGGRGEELERERGDVPLVGGASGGGGGGGEVLVELVRGEREQRERGRVERERRGEVGQALVGQVRRGEELDGGEGERVGGDGGEVERGEVGELLQRDGLGGGVRGADLAVDLGERAGHGRRLAGGRRVGAEGLDEVV